MTVYVLSTGSHSDSDVDAVFDSLDGAMTAEGGSWREVIPGVWHNDATGQDFARIHEFAVVGAASSLVSVAGP